ncbi:MAG: acetolactate synthase small subunit [Anaerolineales bacterium]
MRYTFVVLVENKPGVLNRVASLFRRRNFNIESLAVGPTENAEISRMTIVVECPNGDTDAQDVTHLPVVARDLALIKVKAGPEKRAEVNNLASIFRGRVIDVAPDSLTIEITGTEDKIESLIELLRPFGILEMARTGQIAMTRGTQSGIRRMPGLGNYYENYENEFELSETFS